MIGFLRLSYSLLFPNWSQQKRFIFVLQRDESEVWISSLWANTLELHREDFRAFNVIDWEECFSNKTVETHIFQSFELLFKYLFELHILNKTVDNKDPPWMSGWNKNCAFKWKNSAYCKEHVRTLCSTHSPKNGYYSQFAFFVRMHIIFINMVVISWSDHNS